MMGYSTALRTITSGIATFTMEFSHYEAMNSADQAAVIKAITGFSPLWNRLPGFIYIVTVQIWCIYVVSLNSCCHFIFRSFKLHFKMKYVCKTGS